MSAYFIKHPVIATVIAVLTTLLGIVCLQSLPISQYPEITPRIIHLQAMFPGADAQAVADSVGTPIERQVSGVQHMDYMTSVSSNNGVYSLQVVFEPDSDPDLDQVLTFMRYGQAQSQLPTEVLNSGVTVRQQPGLPLMLYSLTSPDGSYNSVDLANYGQVKLVDEIKRVPGVGEVACYGAGRYSIRIWLKTDMMTHYGISVNEVRAAIAKQNQTNPGGKIGADPVPDGQEKTITVRTQGRLTQASDFEDIIVRQKEGEIVYLKEVAEVELSSENFSATGRLNGNNAAAIIVYQSPGSNAITTVDAVKKLLDEKTKAMPLGVTGRVSLDTTTAVRFSIAEIMHTLVEAIILVGIVVFVFLQTGRATLIPLIAVPVSLLTTFCVFPLLGFTLNTISLLGMVLAIGLVVDDAIVVVEAVQHHIDKGLNPRMAAFAAMQEVSGPVVAIALVLAAVFLPSLLLVGITGTLFKQFAITIAVSMLVSAFNALTLSPALCVLLLKKSDAPHTKFTWLMKLGAIGCGAILLFVPAWLGMLNLYVALGVFAAVIAIAIIYPRLLILVFGVLILYLMMEAEVLNAYLAYGCMAALAFLLFFSKPFFKVFNKCYNCTAGGYAAVCRGMARKLVISIPLLLLLWAAIKPVSDKVPGAFLPDEDQGFLLAALVMKPETSLQQAMEQNKKFEAALQDPKVVKNLSTVVGINILNMVQTPGACIAFMQLKDWSERPGVTAEDVQKAATMRLQAAGLDGVSMVIIPPSIPGVGTSNGVSMVLTDLEGQGVPFLYQQVKAFEAAAMKRDEVAVCRDMMMADVPQKMIVLDKEKCQYYNVDISDVYNVISAYNGSSFVNFFNSFGQQWSVYLQAQGSDRISPDNLDNFTVTRRDGLGEVPLSEIVDIQDIADTEFVMHHQGYNAAKLMVMPKPGYSTQQLMDAMKEVYDQTMDPSKVGFGYQDISFQEDKVRNGTGLGTIFIMSGIFAFLVLAALYEKWALPISVFMTVPIAVLGAYAGLWLCGLELNLYAQIGLVMLVGLAAKNAILIVEFANLEMERGKALMDATIAAARLRLRPILMTSFAFILGCIPLVLSSGSGALARNSIGIVVVVGMGVATLIGIFLIPCSYVFIMRLFRIKFKLNENKEDPDEVGARQYLAANSQKGE